MKLIIAATLLALAAVDATSVLVLDGPDETAGAAAILDDVYCVYWTNCSEECGGGNRHCPRSNGKNFNIDCHLHDCDEIEDCGKADIVFVLDDSTSIGEKNYWVTKQFTIDVMKGLTIGADASRIAMVTYSTIAQTQWTLNAYLTEDALEDAIWDLPKLGGNTNTADGLLHAQQIIEISSRPGVKHIVVVITDGESNLQTGRTIPQAEEMHAQGIEIFAIGIGGINEDELAGIASELKDDHWHHVPDYSALTYITAAVIVETCTAANKTECDEWSAWGGCTVHDGGCGAGNITRTRECRFYNYEGAEPVRRTDIEYKACEIPCPTTTEKPRVTCTSWTPCDADCGKIGFRTCLRSNGRVWKIPCCGRPCLPVPCHTADVVLILDSSISIGEHNWMSARQFAIDVVKNLPLDTEDISIGAVTFSKSATTEWLLGEFHTEEVLEDKLMALPWSAGVTNSQDGLNHARTVFETTGRDGIKKIAIFLSDGESNVHPALTIPAAQKLKDAEVEVFSIAVRKAGIDELKGIASEPEETFYHHIDSYEALNTIVETIVEQTCLATMR